MKRILIFMAAAFCCCAIRAAEPAAQPAPQVASQVVSEEDGWDLFALSVSTDVPGGVGSTKICGVKVGVPVTGGAAPVYGVEASVVWAGCDNVDGLKCSLIGTEGKCVNGVQFSIVNFGVKVNGLQLGVVNFLDGTGFQIGILNFVKGSCIPVLPVINCRF